jgi:hypothetical protein
MTNIQQKTTWNLVAMQASNSGSPRVQFAPRSPSDQETAPVIGKIIAVGMSNKSATVDIAIHKLLLINNLYSWMTPLSRPVHGFEGVQVREVSETAQSSLSAVKTTLLSTSD